jgi:hypothetical protein
MRLKQVRLELDVEEAELEIARTFDYPNPVQCLLFSLTKH